MIADLAFSPKPRLVCRAGVWHCMSTQAWGTGSSPYLAYLAWSDVLLRLNLPLYIPGPTPQRWAPPVNDWYPFYPLVPPVYVGDVIPNPFEVTCRAN